MALGKNFLKQRYIFWKLFILLIVFYILANAGAYFFSDFYMFIRESKSQYQNNNFLKIKTAAGVQLSAIYFPNPNANYTILVSYGNGENLEKMQWYLKDLYTEGYAVFSYDYEGYGTSEGRASEKSLYADVDAAYDYLTTQLQISPDHIIVYGHSLGTGPAVDLATCQPMAGLIVESPFLSLYRVITQIPLLLFDKFNNLRKIKNVKSPILVIHGTADKLIPFWQGKKLYEEANSPKTFLAVKGAGHDNIAAVGKEKYWAAIRNFSKGLNK